MNQQQQIDFTKPLLHYENNVESQEIFNNNREKFSNQCRKIYDAMMKGERLTTKIAMINYDIGDLRRRVKDLRDTWNIPVESELVNGNFKEYFIKLK